MSSPSPQNVNTQFTVGKVNFDNAEGLGNTPLGMNVLYRGAVAWIKPSTFRAIAAAGERGDDSAQLEALMRKGDPIAVPFLELDLVGETDAPENVVCGGHEGRARADAFRAINGGVFMPVQLDFAGLRARHLSPSFFQWLNKHGIVAERSKTLVKLGAERFFWNGQEIKPSRSTLEAKTRLRWE